MKSHNYNAQHIHDTMLKPSYTARAVGNVFHIFEVKRSAYDSAKRLGTYEFTTRESADRVVSALNEQARQYNIKKILER